jgi:hypothetical protein
VAPRIFVERQCSGPRIFVERASGTDWIYVERAQKIPRMDVFCVLLFASLYSATDAGMTPGRAMRGTNEMEMRGMGGRNKGMMEMMGRGRKGMNKNGEPQTYPQGIGMGGGIEGPAGREREKPPSLQGMLDHLDVLDHLQTSGKVQSESMKTLVGLVTHQILDRVSCITNCVNNNENNNEHTCHEQSCLIQYHPDVNSEGNPTLCASSIVIVAETERAVGRVHFAVKTWKVPPMDGMVPTQQYETIDDKFKYRTRSTEGKEIESEAAVCHQFHNRTCPEHPPPVPVNSGDTLYVTVVSLDDAHRLRNLPPQSYRVVVVGSESGSSCEHGGRTLGASGLRNRRPRKRHRRKKSKRELEVLRAKFLENREKLQRHRHDPFAHQHHD